MDDSTRKEIDVPRRGLGELHAYGAAIFPHDALKPYSDSLAELRTHLGVPPATEFKWSPDGGPLHKKWNELKTARDWMLRAAAELHVEAAVVVCAPGLMPDDWSEQRLKTEMLQYLYERITYGIGDEQGVIIADQPGGGRSDETRWLSEALALDTDGTRYVTPETKQVLLPIITTRSDHVAHLQLADLIASATTALVAGAPSVAPHRDGVHKLLMKNVRGYSAGTGLKFMPSATYSPYALMNLAHWVFGEDAYVAPETSSTLGYNLPHNTWLYGNDSGLPSS